LLIAGAERTQGRLEGIQPAADNLGQLLSGAAGGAFGIHRRADRLQRGEHVTDSGLVLGIRGRLAQRVERLGEVVRPALDVIPPGAGVGE